MQPTDMLSRVAYRAFVLAGCLAAAGCALEQPSSAYPWRGQYRLESSTCDFLDSTDPHVSLRLHEDEPGTIALYTPSLPDGWTPVDAVKLRADGDDRLTGSAVLLDCRSECATCMPSGMRYERDDIRGTPAMSIHLELARASGTATAATCNEDSARALAASAVTCTVDATYFTADRI